MNLVNTFTRIRVLFTRRKATEIRLLDVSEHLRRDIGFYNVSSDRRVNDNGPRTEEYVVFGPLTRAP